MNWSILTPAFVDHVGFVLVLLVGIMFALRVTLPSNWQDKVKEAILHPMGLSKQRQEL